MDQLKDADGNILGPEYFDNDDVLDDVILSADAEDRFAEFMATLREAVAKAGKTTDEFNPSEARVQGGPDAGQWTAGGASGVAGAKPQRALNPKAIAVGGDEWNKQAAIRLETEYANVADQIEAIASGGVGATVETSGGDPWGSIGNKQESVEEEFKKNKFDAYLEDEMQIWQENDAMRDAKSVVSSNLNAGYDDEWLADALDEHLAEREANDDALPFSRDDLLKAMSVETDSHNDDDYHLNFNDEALDNAGGVDQSPQFPGFEASKASDRLTEKMRDELRAAIMPKFGETAQELIDKGTISPPDYLSESAQDQLHQAWDDMDDDKKYQYGVDNNIIDKEEESEGSISIPNKFDPLNETTGQDYVKTQRLAHYVALTRAAALIKERGLSKLDDTVLGDELKRVDSGLWESWKESSLSPEGKLLQVASADELGGKLREHEKLDRGEVIKDADFFYANIGGYAGIKAIVRAKWETCQYLLDKAGVHTVSVYRGIEMTGLYPTHELKTDRGYVEEVQDLNHAKFEKLPNLPVMRNGAASTSTDANVSNGWDGANRVVLRAVVPRTAVISLPAFGQNVHSEHEVVVAGTAWDKWDAWRGRAPTFKYLAVSDPHVPPGPFADIEAAFAGTPAP